MRIVVCGDDVISIRAERNFLVALVGINPNDGVECPTVVLWSLISGDAEDDFLAICRDGYPQRYPGVEGGDGVVRSVPDNSAINLRALIKVIACKVFAETNNGAITGDACYLSRIIDTFGVVKSVLGTQRWGAGFGRSGFDEPVVSVEVITKIGVSVE